jgi:hypothetical protein
MHTCLLPNCACENCPPARPPLPCRYKTWSEAVTKAPASVVVLYASDYGFSDRLSQVHACATARHCQCQRLRLAAACLVLPACLPA